MLKTPEATSLELYCRERFRFKAYYDNYIELRYVDDRFTITKDFVRECAQDRHRGISDESLQEVVDSLVNHMEAEVAGLESRSHTGRSL